MNSVQLVGRLATDIDLKEVTGGSKVCSFILAVDRSAEEAEWRVLPHIRGALSAWKREEPPESV